MNMLILNSTWFLVALLIFIFNFIIGFVIGNIHAKNSTMISQKEQKRREEQEKEERKKVQADHELNEFYTNIYLKQAELVPFMDTLELIIHDAINELPVKDSEKVCSSFSYYKRIFKEISSASFVSREDLINFANMHVEYVKIVSMYHSNKKVSLTDLDKISLN